MNFDKTTFRNSLYNLEAPHNFSNWCNIDLFKNIRFLIAACSILKSYCRRCFSDLCLIDCHTMLCVTSCTYIIMLYLQAGKIYMADYTNLEPVKRNTIPLTLDKFVVPNCLGLFHSTSSGEFLPIAIQLIPNDKTSIFTPSDTEYDWLLAKMFFRTTQSCIHEVFKIYRNFFFTLRNNRICKTKSWKKT